MKFINEKTADNIQEPQTLCPEEFDDRKTSPYFLDLRHTVDDKRVLKNPHKGWFWHYVDNGFNRGAYRDQNKAGDHLEDFPGLNHLYLRFDWSDIEKSKGVYDFSPLDGIMDEWGKYGYTFALRVCTFEGWGSDWNACPDYIFEEGAKCYTMPNGNVQPDYSDEIFLHYLELFMRKLGEKYNGDSRIELIDIGTYGTWGEGHTVEGDSRIYPVETVKRHFDLHTKYFPDTFILCNDDHIVGRLAHGMDEVNEILRYAEARGMGLQDDSICCDGYTQINAYDTMRAPWAFERLSEYAPSCIEFAHYTYIRPQFDCHYRNGYTVIEALKNSRATFAGFHGYPRVWLENERYLAEYCANRLGYWFFLTGMVIPPLQRTAHNFITLHIENRGWARAYHDYKLKIRIACAEYEKTITSDFDLRTVKPGGSADIRVRLDLRGFPEGRYRYVLYVGIFDGERPVELAVKKEYTCGGWMCPADTIVLD